MALVHSTVINPDTKPVPCPCYLNQTINGSRALYWDQPRHQASSLSMLPQSKYEWLSCTLLGSIPTPSQSLVHVTSIKISMALVHSTGISTDTKPVPCPCYLNQNYQWLSCTLLESAPTPSQSLVHVTSIKTINGSRAFYWNQHRHQASSLSMLPQSNYQWFSCTLLESAPTPSQSLVHVTSIKLSMVLVHSTGISTDTKPVPCPCYLNQTINGSRALYWDQPRHQASSLSMLPQSKYEWLSCTLLGSIPTPSQSLVHVTSIKISMALVHSTGISTDTKPVPCPCYLNQNYQWLSCTLLESAPTPSQSLVHVTSIKTINGSRAFYWNQHRHQASSLSMLPQSNSMVLVHSTGISTDTKPVPCPCYLNQTIIGSRALYWNQHRHQASSLSMLPQSNYQWFSCTLLESAPTPSQSLVHVTSIKTINGSRALYWNQHRHQASSLSMLPQSKLSMALVHSTGINPDTKPVPCPCYLNQNYKWLSCTLLESAPTPSQFLVHVTSIKLSMALVHSTVINPDTKPMPCPCYLNQTINGSRALYCDQPRHQASSLSMLPQSNYQLFSCILL